METLQRSNSILAQIVESVEAVSIDESIADQYFPLADNFNEVVQMVTTAIRYLLNESFSLAVAYYFNINRNRSPIEIAASVYGDFDHTDYFLQTNDLTGRECMLLPAGRKVVVYLK